MSQDYDHLTLMEKVEVFEQAIESTSGDDLAKVLWLKSPSSEVCNEDVNSFQNNIILLINCTLHKFLVIRTLR